MHGGKRAQLVDNIVSNVAKMYMSSGYFGIDVAKRQHISKKILAILIGLHCLYDGKRYWEVMQN